MPVWHEKTAEWVKQGRLAVVGVIQEQHPDRCRLFAQWKQFGWPILHDPINVLQTSGVPIVVAIDESGIVRAVRPKPDEFQASFLDRDFTPAARTSSGHDLTPSRDSNSLATIARQSGTAQAWRSLGDSLALWESPARVDDAIAAYKSALAIDDSDLPSHFRLGVCLRMRHETADRQVGDFARAVASWETALAGDPNQYIWRRRIQQFGPRLKKPYPFYDWVVAAENAVRMRGELPIQLPVRPSGAEIAEPAKEFSAATSLATSPDPLGRIVRDSDSLVRASVTVVPTAVKPGETARVHVTFAPNIKRRAHWNNEADPLQLWVDAPTRGKVADQLLQTPEVAEAISQEVRRLDFEVQVPLDAAVSMQLRAYALYYVCEDENGQCKYLRQDLGIRLPIQ